MQISRSLARPDLASYAPVEELVSVAARLVVIPPTLTLEESEMSDIVIDNPQASETKVPVSLRIPKALHEQILAHAKERDLPSTTDAFRDLLEFALVAKSEQKDAGAVGHSTVALANVMESLKQELRGDVEQFSLASVYAVYEALAAMEMVITVVAKTHKVELSAWPEMRARFAELGRERLYTLVQEISGRNSDT